MDVLHEGFGIVSYHIVRFEIVYLLLSLLLKLIEKLSLGGIFLILSNPERPLRPFLFSLFMVY